LSEDQILGTEFYVDDPAGLDGIAHRVPASAGNPRLEYWYDTRISGRGKVRCNHCKESFANHFAGYVMVYPTGERILLGRDCGAKHYGQREFKGMLAHFKGAQERAYYAARRRAALAQEGALLAGLEWLEAHPSLSTYRELRRSFRQTLPYLDSVLHHEILRNGPSITHEIKVRDMAAEERRDEEAERRARAQGQEWVPPKTKSPIVKSEWPVYGVVAGAGFFRDEATPADAIASDVRLIKAALGALRDAGYVAVQKGIFKQLNTAFARVREQLARLRDVGNALSDANLVLLCGWAKARKLPGAYKALPQVILFADGKAPVARFTFVPFALASDRPLLEFEAALAASEPRVQAKSAAA
jgi:hypothetical protein